MKVPITSSPLDPNKLRRTPDVLSENLREQLVIHAKDFKTSWIALGQTLFSVWRDKLYYTWGYEKFENYTEEELGLNKSLAIKLLKTYYFLEEEEPACLKEDYAQSKEAAVIPSYEAVNVLRLAKKNKHLTKGDYVKLRQDIFEKGKDVSEIRKDLTALIRERKVVDPEEEREKRNTLAVRKFLYAFDSFKKDMEVLKLLPDDLIEEVSGIMNKLEAEIKI